jgi:hypothetical protein
LNWHPANDIDVKVPREANLECKCFDDAVMKFACIMTLFMDITVSQRWHDACDRRPSLLQHWLTSKRYMKITILFTGQLRVLLKIPIFIVVVIN